MKQIKLTEFVGYLWEKRDTSVQDHAVTISKE